LTGPDLPIARIAELAGFGSEESLRRHFRRIVLTSPTAYREKFGQALAAKPASNIRPHAF
jgi:AraC family transcriptional regulator, transcriptional activator FtrA